MENGGRERDRGSESDEDEDSEQNTSDTGTLSSQRFGQSLIVNVFSLFSLFFPL